MTPAIMQWFSYEHLPDFLQKVSAPFGDVAKWLIEEMPDNEQRAVALQKLLEAKDAAVRSRLTK